MNAENTLQLDQYWMALALDYGERARDEGEIPVGAVLVKDNTLVAAGWNQCIGLNDPSAHAEMQAMRAAGQVLQNYRMPDTTLYVTLEPCAMCSGMLVHSRINRLVIGARDPKTGACGSVVNLVQHERLNHQINLSYGVLEQQCSERLSAFFKQRRAEKKHARQAAKALRGTL